MNSRRLGNDSPEQSARGRMNVTLGNGALAVVLGGNGFIGSHLTDRLLDGGWKVRVLDLAEERYRNPLIGVDYILGDFCDGAVIGKALEGADTVFHLIGTTVPKTSNDNPAFDVETNVVGTIGVLSRCVQEKVRKVVFLSSGGTVYGRPSQLPIHEDHPTNPECSYGITRLAIEKYLALFHILYGLDYIILRPSNVYGARQDPLGIQGAIAIFLGKALAQETIGIWGDGEVIRDYLHVEDLVEGICSAAERSSHTRIYNLGSGIGHSLNDLLRMIEQILGRKVAVRYEPKRAFDVAANILDVRRAERELGWLARISLEDGIGRSLEFVKRIVTAQQRTMGPEIQDITGSRAPAEPNSKSNGI
jgi:UDP-glucose 4-epimerase